MCFCLEDYHPEDLSALLPNRIQIVKLFKNVSRWEWEVWTEKEDVLESVAELESVGVLGVPVVALSCGGLIPVPPLAGGPPGFRVIGLRGS